MTLSFRPISTLSNKQHSLSEQGILTDTQHTAGSAESSLNASDPPGQLNVLGEEGDSVGM